MIPLINKTFFTKGLGGPWGEYITRSLAFCDCLLLKSSAKTANVTFKEEEGLSL